MALFARDQLRARSTLSRFLAQLPEAPVQALCTLFLDDLLSRPLTTASDEKQTEVWWIERKPSGWSLISMARGKPRALVPCPRPQTCPRPFADWMRVSGYTGRKRGEVVRTRRVISQAHHYHWFGSFGTRGNGRYRQELRQALAAIARYLAAHQLPQARALLRLDGHYGDCRGAR